MAKHTKKAWYIDDNVVLPGTKDKYGFHPAHGLPCGFSVQKIRAKDVNKTIFYEMNRLIDYARKNNIKLRIPNIDKNTNIQ